MSTSSVVSATTDSVVEINNAVFSIPASHNLSLLELEAEVTRCLNLTNY